MVLILAVFLSLGSGLWMQKYEPFEGATTAQTDAKPGAAGILAAKDPGHEVMSKVVYITTRDTTSTTIITIFLCCVSALLMYLLWQYMVQARKLGELERRCKALLEERRHDKGQLKGLRDENQRLSVLTCTMPGFSDVAKIVNDEVVLPFQSTVLQPCRDPLAVLTFFLQVSCCKGRSKAQLTGALHVSDEAFISDLSFRVYAPLTV